MPTREEYRRIGQELRGQDSGEFGEACREAIRNVRERTCLTDRHDIFETTEVDNCENDGPINNMLNEIVDNFSTPEGRRKIRDEAKKRIKTSKMLAHLSKIKFKIT